MKSSENYKVIKPAANNEPATIEIMPTKNSNSNIYKDEPIPKRR